MTQFCAKVQKAHFCLFLGPFCPKSREREFSQTWDFCRKLANHKTLHFRLFLAKTNDSFFCKSPKTLFLPIFGPFLSIFGKMRIFSKNRALSLFYIYGPLTSYKKLEKTNEPILRTLHHWLTDRQTDWQTDRRHWIHRTFTPETWVQKTEVRLLFALRPHCVHTMYVCERALCV